MSTLQMDNQKIDELARVLSKQIDAKVFANKYAPAKDVLKLVGAGVFLGASIILPNLPLALKPFLRNQNEFEIWKRFNIPYLKRTLSRLESQKLVEIGEKQGMQIIKITDQGRQKILKMAIDNLELSKPKIWDGRWRLVVFDLPETRAKLRKILAEYLKVLGFYPLQKSVYLHAYPCEKEVEFLREYLTIGSNVRIFITNRVENEQEFLDFFGV